MQENTKYRTGLYLRLSKDDEQKGESFSIGTQRAILTDYCKVNSPIKEYANIQELTPEILNTVIERIEISHVKYNSKPGSVIHIYWKLK